MQCYISWITGRHSLCKVTIFNCCSRVEARLIYFNVRNLRVQKIPRFLRMSPEFPKFNGHEKNFDWFAKINSHESSFQFFLVIFCSLQHKNRLFKSFFQHFCRGKPDFAKINSHRNNFCWFTKLHSIKTSGISRMAWFAKFSRRKIF